MMLGLVFVHGATWLAQLARGDALCLFTSVLPLQLFHHVVQSNELVCSRMVWRHRCNNLWLQLACHTCFKASNVWWVLRLSGGGSSLRLSHTVHLWRHSATVESSNRSPGCAFVHERCLWWWAVPTRCATLAVFCLCLYVC